MYQQDSDLNADTDNEMSDVSSVRSSTSSFTQAKSTTVCSVAQENPPIDEFLVYITHDRSKLRLSLGAFERAMNMTANELSEIIEQLTSIPRESQKLIYKGKDLTKSPTLNLSDLDIKNNGNILVLGKKFDPDSDAMFFKLTNLEKKANDYVKMLMDLKKEAENLEKSFVPSDASAKAVANLLTRCLGCSEDLSRLLERLDSLLLNKSSSIVKTKRKNIVIYINSALDEIDALKSRLESLLEGT